jgi:hypothetical protein
VLPWWQFDRGVALAGAVSEDFNGMLISLAASR